MKLGTLCSALALVLSFSVSAHAKGVRIVDAAGGPSYATIQAAIDAASDGDVLLVGRGSYGAFTIDGKALSIFTEPQTSCGSITVRNISATKRVVLVGLSASATGQYALALQNNPGEVRVEFCTLVGRFNQGNEGCPGNSSGSPAAYVDNTAFAVFYACAMIGGNGAGDGFFPNTAGGGGRGLHAQSSSVALYNCTLRGGNGGDGWCLVGSGGTGCFAAGPFLFASGCSFQGGNVGVPTTGAQSNCGGNGLYSGSGVAHYVACTFQAGQSGYFQCNPAAPIAGNGTFVAHAYDVTHATGGTVAEAGAAFPLTISGAPGAPVFLAASRGTAFRYMPAIESLRLVPFPILLPTMPLGTIPPSGVMQVGLVMPTSVAGAGEVFFLQTAVLSAPEPARLGNPLNVLVLDRSSAPDCDGDGSCDYLQAFENYASDVNANLIPDSCPGG